MFTATRRRLALWYTLVTAVLLLLFASGFYLYVRSTLIERVDDTLHHVVEVVERSLVLEPAVLAQPSDRYQVNWEASFRVTSPAVEDDRIELEWFDPTGALLWSTLSEPLTLPVSASQRAETVALTPDLRWRQLTERVEEDHQVLGYLRVSHPWFEVTKPTRELTIELSLGLTLMVTAVGAIGWFLSRLAIEPIRESYQSLRQFTADASHELRNPIALIQTTVQAALTDPEMTPMEQRLQFHVVERLTQRLGRLVDDLLFLARQDSGVAQPQFQPCPLDAVVLQVVEEQSPAAAAKQVNLTVTLGDVSGTSAEPFTINGDYEQLLRLLTNLMSNGIRHTPAGGTVALSLEEVTAQGQSALRVRVVDDGEGIPETAIPHLFDRFYRGDPARSRPATQAESGTGLGLAIAQAITQTHRGQIQVSSQLGKGTTFTVIFPQVGI
jgi:two-component system, OmpR family, manganese sensing sensor histidine kinase